MNSLKTNQPSASERIVEVIEQQFKKPEPRNLVINCGDVDLKKLNSIAVQVCAHLNIGNLKPKDPEKIKILLCDENKSEFLRIYDIAENRVYSAKWRIIEVDNTLNNKIMKDKNTDIVDLNKEEGK